MRPITVYCSVPQHNVNVNVLSVRAVKANEEMTKLILNCGTRATAPGVQGGPKSRSELFGKRKSLVSARNSTTIPRSISLVTNRLTDHTSTLR